MDQKDKVKKCIELSEQAEKIGKVIIENAGLETDQEIKDRDVMQNIRDFNVRFEEFRMLFDSLDDEGRNGAGDSALRDALILSLKHMIQTNSDVTKAAEKVMAHTHDRMGVLGQARAIFNKFVKTQPGQTPRFYDKKG